MRILPDGAREAPWDSRALGMECFEMDRWSPEISEWLSRTEGFFTLKVPSESTKGDYEKYGFIYCDTLLEPYCSKKDFVGHENGNCSLSGSYRLEKIVEMVYGTFTHDRFHKDKRIPAATADLRYVNWLEDLDEQKRLWAFCWGNEELAGFWACDLNGKVVLHALAEPFRGRGLAKFFWSEGCRMHFDSEFDALTSSVSTSNLSVVNLYFSLGFSMKKAVDVYHLFR